MQELLTNKSLSYFSGVSVGTRSSLEEGFRGVALVWRPGNDLSNIQAIFAEQTQLLHYVLVTNI